MIIKAELSHLDEIMKCIDDAKRFLKKSGSTQWNGSDGYPRRENLEEDIINGSAHICVRNGIVCGVCAYCGYEPVYDNPKNGTWLTATNEYATVHRVAVRDEARGMGVAHELIAGSIEYARNHGLKSVRIDTHPKNMIMQHIILSTGFTNCGYVDYKRIEFEPTRLIYEYVV